MAELSQEPSMEDILSSIKKIISDDSDKALAPTRRPRTDPGPSPRQFSTGTMAEDKDQDVLELNDAIASTAGVASPLPLVSPTAEAASRSAFEALQSASPKPVHAPVGGQTIDELARELLRPMLKDWLDAHLPGIVEGVVSKEVARISGRPL